jgi:hypothetical protein
MRIRTGGTEGRLGPGLEAWCSGAGGLVLGNNFKKRQKKEEEYPQRCFSRGSLRLRPEFIGLTRRGGHGPRLIIIYVTKGGYGPVCSQPQDVVVLA